MRRRNFCKSLAMTAASTALASNARSLLADQPDAPPGFDHYTEDYAAFCAQPPEDTASRCAAGRLAKRQETKLNRISVFHL